METALFVVAVLAAGLACPAMMWWQRRRGREDVCCVPAPLGMHGTRLERLRERERNIARMIAEREQGHT